jgi:hypothetical protein
MSAYVKGKGTSDEPFVINNEAGIIQMLTTDLSKGLYFVLACNVTMLTSVARTEGWPVSKFILDALGHELIIKGATLYNYYFFRSANPGDVTIKNCKLTVNISNGSLTSGTIKLDNCLINEIASIHAASTVSVNCISWANHAPATGSSNSFSVGISIAGLTRLDTLPDPYNKSLFSAFDKSVWAVDGNSYPRLIPRTIPYITQFWAVKGIVKIGGIPAKRRISAHHPVDFYLISETESNEVDGTYLIDCGGYTDHVYVIHSEKYGDKFSANKAYAIGDVIHPTPPNGYRYICGIAGVSASSAPTDWPINTALISGGASFDPQPVYSPYAHMVTPVLYDSVTGLPV